MVLHTSGLALVRRLSGRFLRDYSCRTCRQAHVKRRLPPELIAAEAVFAGMKCIPNSLQIEGGKRSRQARI